MVRQTAEDWKGKARKTSELLDRQPQEIKQMAQDYLTTSSDIVADVCKLADQDPRCWINPWCACCATSRKTENNTPPAAQSCASAGQRCWAWLCGLWTAKQRQNQQQELLKRLKESREDFREKLDLFVASTAVEIKSTVVETNETVVEINKDVAYLKNRARKISAEEKARAGTAREEEKGDKRLWSTSADPDTDAGKKVLGIKGGANGSVQRKWVRHRIRE